MKIKKSYRWALKNGSGKLDDQIVCTRSGKTFLRKAPATGYNKIPTPKQAACREKFKAARLFALSVINDPALKEIYKLKAGGKCSAYSKAVSEYLLKNGGQ